MPVSSPNDLIGYIPQDRRRALLHGYTLPDRATGAAMFADVTGFTPLAESLAQALGPRRGAEELTGLLNQVYSALVAQVERFGGSVISFSGDAMTCWFDDSSVEFSVLSSELDRDSTQISELKTQNSGALRAAACALAMREAMGAFAAIPTPAGGTAALMVKVALAAGRVRRFLIGDERIQLLEVLAGRTIDRLGAVAPLAQHDDVLADAETLDRLGSAIAIGAWREDPKTGARAGVIVELTAPVAPTPSVAPPALAEATIRPWLLPAVRERLRGSSAPFLAELRPAVALMLQFGGLDYEQDDAGGRLDAYIRQVQRIVTRAEGILVDVTMADKGGYLYVAFGAPVAHEDDAARALRVALQLRDLPVTSESGAVRIGLSQGIMRTGPYGGASRCTYGVLGDDVNLACRLMSAAPQGQILVGGRLRDPLSASFFWNALPAMRVRGKRAPVEVYRLLGEPETTTRPPALPPPGGVGRAAERRALDAALDGLLAGTGSVAIVEGDPGIGKSYLVAELVRSLRERGVATLLGVGQSVEQQTAYWAWRGIFSAFFTLDDAVVPDDRRARARALAGALVPELADRLPLLNDVLNLVLPDTDLTRALAGSLRSESLSALLIELLRAGAAAGPLALVIEDAHWLDSRSWALAARVAQALLADRLPLLLVLATRQLDAAHVGMAPMRALLGSGGVRWLRLGRLGRDDTIALASDRFGIAPEDLPAPVADLLHDRSGGNPLFVEELAATLREQGLIRIESDSADPLARPRCTVARGLSQAGSLLPATLRGLLLARIDRLPPEQQLTLKVASVVGPTFAFAPLHFARSQQVAIGAAPLKEHLRTLAAQDYTWLEEPEPNLAYRFKHILTQEAAYETLLYAQRRALHRALAEWYERTFGDKQTRRQADEAQEASPVSLSPFYPLLAHHYRYAEAPERERHYAWLAGIQAAEQYANAEAVAFFTRALELTPAHDLARRYEVLSEREAAEELLALRDDQARDLAALAELAEALDDDRKRAEVARSQARYAERVGDIAAMRALAARAVALAEASGATELAIRSYDQWAWACMRAGGYAEGRAQAEAGLRLARASGLRSQEAQLLTALGCACVESGEYAIGRDYLEQSRRIFHDLGRQRGESVALGNLGEALIHQGDYATAREYLEETLRLYRVTGDRRNEGWALGNIGMVAMQLGDYSAARAYHQQACDVARRAGDRNTESLALAALALIAHQLGDDPLALQLGEQALRGATVTFTRIRALLVLGHALAEVGRFCDAADRYGQARDAGRAAGLSSRAIEATAGLARVAQARGDIAGALALVGPLVEQLSPEAVAGADEPLRVFLTCYQVLHAAGDPRAEAVLSAARALLCSRAARIADESLRRAFLEQVPAHRAILYGPV